MEFYNHGTKLEYLETLKNPEVRELIESLFAKSKNTEEFYGKDLYDFNLEQIGKVIENVNPATYNSVINTKSRINVYITWAIENGRRSSNINPLHGTDSEWAESFLVNQEERYFNDTDLHDLLDVLENDQDKALIQCIFEGISGQGMSELISMNYNNIDFENNLVKVTNSRDNKERTVKVSDKCIEYIKKAYHQTVYIDVETGNEKELINYQGSIFKKTQWRNTQDEQINRANLAKRLYQIKEAYKFQSLTVNTISESGRIKMAADIYKEKGELTKDDFTKIGDQFNLGKMTVNGYTYYDVRKMKHYINKNNLEALYGLENVKI